MTHRVKFLVTGADGEAPNRTRGRARSEGRIGAVTHPAVTSGGWLLDAPQRGD
jgi:hypothetical protein